MNNEIKDIYKKASVATICTALLKRVKKSIHSRYFSFKQKNF